MICVDSSALLAIILQEPRGQECLDALVGGAQPVGQAAAELTLPGEDGTGEPGGIGVLVAVGQGQPQLGEAEVDGSVLGVGHDSILVPVDPPPLPGSENGQPRGLDLEDPGV